MHCVTKRLVTKPAYCGNHQPVVPLLLSYLQRVPLMHWGEARQTEGAAGRREHMPHNLRGGSFIRQSRDMYLRCGEEIAQAPGLFTLCQDETIMSFKMAGVVESGGEHFV